MIAPPTIGHRFDVILVLLMVLYAATAALEQQYSQVITSICLGSSWLLVFQGDGLTAWTRRARGATVIMTALLVVANGSVTTPFDKGALALVLSLALLGLPVVILHRVMRHHEVTFQTVMGCICVHVLIGVIFAELYLAADRFTDGAAFGGKLMSGADCLYFSFVTLTSLGFGDIAPVGPGARALVPLEALLGQIYLATLVARFVGSMGARGRAKQDP